jgi:iron complex transport system substrate-binding protein
MNNMPIVAFIVGYVYFAKWFPPDLFHDLDPQAIHQEDISKLIRIDVDLSKRGVFVYPEE